MLFFCFFEANRNYACCSILLFDNQSGRKSAMSGNGGQKNLEELKKSVHVTVTKDFVPNDRLWIHPLVPPPPPSNLVAKRDSFPPTLSKIQHCLG